MERTLTRNARLLSPEELALRLGEFYRALNEFNDGYYFEAHETLEDLWRITPVPERRFFQGVIQLAAAFVHVARGERAGVLKLLDAASAKLREFSPDYLGVDVAALITDVAVARAAVAEADREGTIRTAAAPRVRFVRRT